MRSQRWCDRRKGGNLHGAKLAVGDASDNAALHRALKSQDAVISALGTPPSPYKEVTLLSTATRALVDDDTGLDCTPLVTWVNIPQPHAGGSASCLPDLKHGVLPGIDRISHTELPFRVPRQQTLTAD